MSEFGITLIAGLLMVVGLVGLFVPILPDAPIIWLAALGYGLLAGWGRLGPFLFAGITVLGLAAALAEVWGGGLGARAGGASLWGIAGGLLLGLVCLIFLGPVGAIGGLLLGTFLVELWRQRDSKRALRGMLGMGVGYGLAFFVKAALLLSMVALWLVWVLTP